MVIKLPEKYPVFDFTVDPPVPNPEDFAYGIGRYLEKRPFLYTENQYRGRVVHMGIDIQAPVGTEVYSPVEAKIWGVANNHLPQDYGYTIITEQIFEGKKLWALYGHLSGQSIEGKKAGDAIKKHEALAWVGDTSENGGWPAHLHFQLSWQLPTAVDMPGVVAEDKLLSAQKIYPDPRILLGPIY